MKIAQDAREENSIFFFLEQQQNIHNLPQNYDFNPSMESRFNAVHMKIFYFFFAFHSVSLAKMAIVLTPELNIHITQDKCTFVGPNIMIIVVLAATIVTEIKNLRKRNRTSNLP